MTDEDIGLREWRRRAANIVLAACAILQLPVMFLFLGGYGPAVTWRLKVTVVAIYLTVVAAALARRLEHRVRVWMLLGSIYALSVVGIAAFPTGPYARAIPFVAPIIAIGLAGTRPARTCGVMSAAVWMIAPFLGSIPAIARLMGLPNETEPAPAVVVWLQGFGLTAGLFTVMIMLERFYAFLTEALGAERRASADRAAASLKLEAEAHERRRLEHEIATIADRERRDLGNEVHDGLCQQLTGALLRCEVLQMRVDDGAPPSANELGDISSLLAQSIQEARSIALGLCPLEPTPDALAPALRVLTRRIEQMSAVPCRLVTSGKVDVPNATTAQHIYRLAQEALSNAVRHAHASRIEVELRGVDESLMLRVEDDGVGLPRDLPTAGMGLKNMAFRARVIDAEFAIQQVPGGGTRVSCRVPRRACLAPSGPHAVENESRV